MSIVANSDDFFTNLQGVFNRYDLLFPQLARLRAQYTDQEWNAQHPELEFHRRCYVINDLLALLNWRLDQTSETGLPNLVPEQALSSDQSGHTRFLDYLGFERETERPLLVVEAKRRLDLSFLKSPTKNVATPVSPVAALSRGLSGEKLKGPWSEWLETLADYVHSVMIKTGVTPQRVMLTDGKIVFVFLDPADAFISGGARLEDEILMFQLEQLTASTASQLFRALVYDEVARNVPLFTPAQLPFVLDPKDVTRAMHGLRLVYEKIARLHRPSPVVTVCPVLLAALVMVPGSRSVDQRRTLSWNESTPSSRPIWRKSGKWRMNYLPNRECSRHEALFGSLRTLRN